MSTRHESQNIFSDKQINSLILYSFNGDVIINNYLKNGNRLTKEFAEFIRTKYYLVLNQYKNDFLNDTDMYLNTYIENFYKTLKSTFIVDFNEDTIIYRGITSSKTTYQKGDIIFNVGFMSCTCDRNVAIVQFKIEFNIYSYCQTLYLLLI